MMDLANDTESTEMSQLSHEHEIDNTIHLRTSNKISYGSLINWNIAKALHKNPNINLKEALKITQHKLKGNSFHKRCGDLQTDEHYLTCALLAWQSLGENDIDRLYQFIERNRACDRERNKQEHVNLSKPTDGLGANDNMLSYDQYIISTMKESFSTIGPVVKLPVESTIVMRVDNPGCCNRGTPCKVKPNTSRATQKKSPSSFNKKPNDSCCGESSCTNKLTNLDQSTAALRKRATQLARREAERVELLERAEAAWRDLEMGYQRRLQLAEEKEIAMNKKIEKLIEERNRYKDACVPLAVELRRRSTEAEDDRTKLGILEKHVLERACVRHRFADEAARGDSCLADQQCKASQLDRDLQFKEEQAERVVAALQNSIESAQVLSHESERAMRADMAALKEQAKLVSKQLIDEDATIKKLKSELDDLNYTKESMMKDLDGCQLRCDDRMQKGMEELKKKRQELNKLKERVLECQCKLPVDASIQVKRTPSLAALCSCQPDDRICDPCSCTSLRSSLMTNLLADLFAGLQSELGSGVVMPCQLLKCLEDKHNWDQATAVKTKLRDFFSKLLLGELDIAIATSIEKYHARWVGATCADTERTMAELLDAEKDVCEAHKRMQEREIEARAQELATKLAEELFKEKAEQLAADRAKEILSSGPPPCECAKANTGAQAYPCLLQPKPLQSRKNNASTGKNKDVLATYWLKTHKDVTQLRTDIECLKKDSIKKEDLRSMEKKLTKIVQRATNTDQINEINIIKPKTIEDDLNKNYILQLHDNENIYKINGRKFKSKANDSLLGIKKFNSDLTRKSNARTGRVNGKSKIEQTLAVNVCLCGIEKSQVKASRISKDTQKLSLHSVTKPWKHYTNGQQEVISVKQSKPISTRLPSQEIRDPADMSSLLFSSREHSCEEDCACFNKLPSNTSIEKLLGSLMKWQSDYSEVQSPIDNNKSFGLNMSILLDKCQTNIYDNKYEESQVKIAKTEDLQSVTKVLTGLQKLSNESQLMTECPKTTESEYISTVNLEKSSVNITDSSNKNKIIDTKNTVAEKSLRFDENINVTSNNSGSKNLSECVMDINKKTSCHKEKSNKIDNTNIIKESVPKKCDYSVKFLGVTLIDEPILSNTTEESVDDDKKHYSGQQLESKIKYKYDKSSCKYKIVQQLYDKKNEKSQEKKLSTNMHIGSDNNNNNVKDNSFKASQTSLCVCCKSLTKDLEENIFQLLQEHITHKLRVFQESSCKSICIHPEQEQKMLSSMFNKIKSLIAQNMNKIKCECPYEKQLENSWNRAFGLLQEYLKVKMKRLQCSCNDKFSSNKDINEDIYQEMLSKVCELIECDFNRIKCLCTCDNIPNSSVKSDNFHVKYNHKSPVNNKTDIQINILNQPIIPDKIDANSQYLEDMNDQDVAQLSEHYRTETKASNDIEKTSINTQTLSDHSQRLYTIVTERGCLNNEQTLQIVRRNEILVTCRPNIVACNNIGVITANNMSNNDHQPLTFVGRALVHNLDDSTDFDNNDIDDRKQLTNIIKSTEPTKIIMTHPISPLILRNTENDIYMPRRDEYLNFPYIDCTVDCSSDKNFGTSICKRALINVDSDKLKNICNNLVKKHAPIENYYNKITDQVKPDVEVTGNLKWENESSTADDNVENSLKIANHSLSCETDDYSDADDSFILKSSISRTISKKCMIVNTDQHEEKRLDFFVNEKYRECSKEPCLPTTIHSDRKIFCVEKNCTDQVSSPPTNCDTQTNTISDSRQLNNFDQSHLLTKGSAEFVLESTVANKTSVTNCCECKTVPLCHIKMLVENIEQTLLNKSCTCSFSPKVCPKHMQL